LRAINTNDFGTHVGEQHGGKRTRPDASDFNDFVSSKWSRHDEFL
jgi:hypothetical protein